MRVVRVAPPRRHAPPVGPPMPAPVWISMAMEFVAPVALMGGIIMFALYQLGQTVFNPRVVASVLLLILLFMIFARARAAP